MFDHLRACRADGPALQLAAWLIPARLIPARNSLYNWLAVGGSNRRRNSARRDLFAKFGRVGSITGVVIDLS